MIGMCEPFYVDDTMQCPNTYSSLMSNGTASLCSYCILQIDLSSSTVLSKYAYSQPIEEANEAVRGVRWCVSVRQMCALCVYLRSA